MDNPIIVGIAMAFFLEGLNIKLYTTRWWVILISMFFMLKFS